MQKPTINTNAPVTSAMESLQTGAQQIAASIQKGVPPTNAQIGEAIDTTTSFLEQSRHEGKVTGQAEKAISDVERVLEDTKMFLEQRNPGNLLQKAVIHGGEAAASLSKETAAQTATLPFKAAEYQGQAKTIFAASTDLVQQLVRSGEFRRLLLEFVDVIESSLWRVEKTAEGETKEAPSLTGALKKDIATVQHPTSEGLPSTQKAASELAKRLQRAVQDETALTEDEKKRLRLRFSNVLKSLKTNTQFHVATQNLINMLGYLREEVIQTLNAASNTQASAEFQYSWSKATYEAQKFLEGFTGDKTLKNLSCYLRKFMDELSRDKKIDNLLDEAKTTLNQALENPQRLVDDQGFINRVDTLMKNTRQWLRDMKDNDYLQGITDECRTILEAIRDDPLRQRLANDAQIMIQDFMTYDANGRPVLNLELINQMKGLLVPLLKEHLRWVPLPRIEGSNDTYDYWFDNVVFSAPDLVPDKIHIRMFTEGDFALNNLEPENFVTLLKFSEEGIKTTLKNVHFWFRRKAFPRVEDSGVANVEFTGDGIKIDIIISVRPGDRPFHVRRANLHVDGLNVHVADTKHDFLYNAISTIFAPAIKTRMEDSLQQTLGSIVYGINDQLNRIVVKTFNQIESQLPVQTSRISQTTH